MPFRPAPTLKSMICEAERIFFVCIKKSDFPSLPSGIFHIITTTDSTQIVLALNSNNVCYKSLYLRSYTPWMPA